MANKNPSVAVIGCGYWGKNLVRNFHELGALAALCDPDAANAQKLSDSLKVPVRSFEEILKDDKIDGVVIASPAALHADLAGKALRAGKNVFVEKPLALKISDAKGLCAEAEKANRVLMVGHLLQYHPAFLTMADMVRKGTLGKVQYIYSNRLNIGKIRNEENILWSFAPHDISMILALAGSTPEEVYATGSCYLNPNVHDVTTTHLSFANGINAHIFVCWLNPFKEQKLVVVGDRGMMVFDDSQAWGEKLLHYPHQVTWVDGNPVAAKADAVPVPLEVAEPLKLECAHFLECITKGQKARTDGEEGLRVLSVLDAAQRSLTTGKKTKITDETASYFVHETALVDAGCTIGEGSKIWHFSHILGKTSIGKNVIIGQNVMIGPEVTVGNNCKIQNNVSLYKGVTLEDGVFCGPSCVFTNVNTPRAEIERKNEFLTTNVGRGVTIGANSTIVCGNNLGAYALIGAGAVVTKDVPAHALVVGNPAKQIGWVSHSGERLGADLKCPREGRQYKVTAQNTIEEVTNVSTDSKRAHSA